MLLFVALTSIHAERINIPGLELPQLIISEVRPEAEAQAYVELTNVGSTTLDLSEFMIYSGWGNTRVTTYTDSLLVWSGSTNTAIQSHLGRVYLKGELAPGESFVVSTAWDHNDSYGRNIPNQNTAVAALSDQLVHKKESNNLNGWIDMPEWQCYPFDSISPIVYSATDRYPQLMGNGSASYGYSSAFYLLSWRFEVDSAVYDSTYIDNFNFFYANASNPNSTQKGTGVKTSIAGVSAGEHRDYVMVRKTSVTEGNMNWDQSRGVDAATSEWLVLPEPSSKQFAFTTVGSHGDAAMDIVSKFPSIVEVDNANKTLTVPSNIYRYDSLSYYIDLDPGMAWSYKLNDSFEDTAKFTVCDGDTVTFYAVGDAVVSESYHIKVKATDPSLAQVFPTRKRLQIYDEEADTLISEYWSSGAVYGVTENYEVDSITGIAFDTRVDSIFKYLLKPEGSKLELITHDNSDRVDVQAGDVLRVTSSDESNYKDYALSVNDYSPSSDARLRVVTWPDINPLFYPRWTMSDTLVEFTANKTVYNIELFPGATEVPAFQFKPYNVKSTITVDRAKNLKGSIDERTTTVSVMAQDDSTAMVYKFVFERLSPEGSQPYIAEPFFSEFIWQQGTQGWAIEIYNPGTEALDLSQYAILKNEPGDKTWQGIIQSMPPTWNASRGLRIYENFYVPARRWKNDGSETEWKATPTVDNPTLGSGFLRSDNETDAIVKAKDVWVASVGTKTGHMGVLSPADFVFTGITNGSSNPLWDKYAWSDSTFLYLQANPAWNDAHGNYYLVKIKNDSILDGTMHVNTNVYDNYELIDMVVFKGDSVAGKWTRDKSDNRHKDWFCRRKASSYYPIKEARGGAKETAETSDWIAYSSKWPDWSELPSGTTLYQDLGQHITDPITGYLSTITSSTFNIDLGYEGDDLKITGDVTAYTPTTILDVINKATPNQALVFTRGGSAVAADAKLAGGDVLTVTSDDGLNSTTYTLVDRPLNDDTSLTANAGSGLTVTGTVVSGVDLTSTVKELVAKVSVNPLSVLEIEDANGALLPKTVHNLDTLVYDQVVSSNVKLAVRAENGDKVVYSLDFGLTNSDAYLFSTIYPIDQDKKMLGLYPIGLTPKSIREYVFANEGATYRILDKKGFVREIGNIQIDDVIEVTSQDGSTVVTYQFPDYYNDALEIDEDVAPQVRLYPNPTKSRLYISGVDVKSVEVFALSGQKLLSESVFAGSINVSGLAKGIYLVKVQDVNGLATTLKFMKE